MIARMPQSRRPADRATFRYSRLALAFSLVLTSAACAMFASPASEDVERSNAFIKRAVGDTETVANRARVYHDVNSRKRAAIEVEEAEVILQKARDEQGRIRQAYRAAIAVLSAIPDENAKSVAASEKVDRIKAILAESDRRVAEIEATVASLRELDIPPVR